jgi:hypothetical protein
LTHFTITKLPPTHLPVIVNAKTTNGCSCEQPFVTTLQLMESEEKTPHDPSAQNF